MASFLYCLNSSTIKPTPILDKIRIAGEAGYQAIELWHDDIDAHLAGGGSLPEIRRAVEDAGLDVPTTIFLKGWWDTSGAIYSRAMDEIRRRLAQAAEVGATYAIAGPPLGMVEFTVGAERYRNLLEIGLKFGVRPAMEYLGFADEVNTIEDALAVMDGSGQPEATIVLDPFHCFRGGGPMESIRKLTAERIAISHFNDSPDFPARELQQDPDRVLPGDGCVDLKTYCNLLREVGYDRWLSLELFRRDLWAQDPREVARIGLEKMRAAAEG
ncbi:MAG TPA: sugar phosphate isomerase/epimerase [Planctomycetaceae bacterium]|nr:sugar phosphate isomerase/epimerase [Planctomycetaceae bacterium]